MLQQTLDLPTAAPVTWIESGREGGSMDCRLAIDCMGYRDGFVQLIGIPLDDPTYDLHVFVRSYELLAPYTMMIPTFGYDGWEGLVRYDTRLAFASRADMLLVEEAIAEILTPETR